MSGMNDSSPAPCSIPDNVKTALKWFVNNWICDWNDGRYTEEFCGNETDCRRCMAKHLLESNVEAETSERRQVMGKIYDVTELAARVEGLEYENEKLKERIEKAKVAFFEIGSNSGTCPSDCSPRIVQLLMTPQDATWQNRLLGLGSDGVTYSVNHNGFWEPFVPPLGVTENVD